MRRPMPAVVSVRLIGGLAMAEYKVNADFLINVSVWVEAESEEEARREGRAAILNKECEWQDPIEDPKINWVEREDDDEDERLDDDWMFDASGMVGDD